MTSHNNNGRITKEEEDDDGVFAGTNGYSTNNSSHHHHQHNELHHQRHAPALSSKEEVLVFTTSQDDDDDDAPPSPFPSPVVGTGKLDPLLQLLQPQPQQVEDDDVDDEAPEQKEQEPVIDPHQEHPALDGGDSGDDDDDDDSQQQQQPVPAPAQASLLLVQNRFQNWKKQATEMAQKTTTLSSSSSTTVQNYLWKRRGSQQDTTTATTGNDNGTTSKPPPSEEQQQEEKSNRAATAAAAEEEEELTSTTVAEEKKTTELCSSSAAEATTTDAAVPADADRTNNNNNQGDDDGRRSSIASSSAYEYGSEAASSAGSSFYSSSYYTESATSGSINRPRVLQWAAASVVDSMSMHSFRGRYSSSSAAGGAPAAALAAEPSSSSAAVAPVVAVGESPLLLSQAARIRQSNNADHWEQLHKNLQEHEYILLLGRGMLGVNLKQCYKKIGGNGGVYTDYLVPGGAADASRVVQVGDVVVRVGDIDCTKGTIATVPQIIATSKRPVPIVLTTNHVGMVVGTTTTAEDETDNINASSSSTVMNHVDVAVGVLHALSLESSPPSNKPANVPEDENDNADEADDDDDDASTSANVGQPQQPQLAVSDEEMQVPSVTVPDITKQNDDFCQVVVNPGVPDAAVQTAYHALAARRNTDARIENVLDSNLDHALRNAFMLCVADGRRRAFLERHYNSAEEGGDALLKLFVELRQFVETFDINPNRQETARDIAYKYFLPNVIDKDVVVPPIIDFHSLVADSELRSLEAALLDDDGNGISKDTFVGFQKAAMESLSLPFLNFLTSAECARMRACLRHTAPFTILPSWTDILQSKLRLQYHVVYLLCLTQREGNFGENDDIVEAGPRIENAASGLCASLFLYHKILPATLRGESTLKEWYEKFWSIFVASGALDHYSGDLKDRVEQFRSALWEIHKLEDDPLERSLQTLSGQAKTLADSLLYDYATHVYPEFQQHKFHEWLCSETANDEEPTGCIKRLLRKAHFPVGVTPHKPLHAKKNCQSKDITSSSDSECAECAIVFGTGGDDNEIVRFACQSLGKSNLGFLSPDEIPPTLESYAVVPRSRRRKPFSGDRASWACDGWEISLVNFILPRADASDGEDASLYGVSLCLQCGSVEAASISPSKMEFVLEESDQDALVDVEGTCDGEVIRRIRVAANIPTFVDKLSQSSWSDQLISKQINEDEKFEATIGLALVSTRNTIMSMRETLSLVIDEMSKKPDGTACCSSLVDVLGNFHHADVELQSLRSLLEPYIRRCSSTWLERPIGSQKYDFLQLAGHQLVRSLPPIPLALTFVTALLEQKIVLSSSRRSVLFSVTTALTELLKPLKWCHLLVPLVPASLAVDLLQYPAPFVLGIPSEDPGAMDLIRELPDDVTLVDLDVGRVILAPAFAHNNEFGCGTPNNADTTRLLRSQVLFLAQSLGGVFGEQLDPETWKCDDPARKQCISPEQGPRSQFDVLRSLCNGFLQELLAGTTCCCYWLEDGDSDTSPPTVLFDEDRFFRIKKYREQGKCNALFEKESYHFAMPLKDFSLILELLLRCQSMNEYIGTRTKNEMAFSLEP